VKGHIGDMATAFLPNRDPQRGPDQDEDLAAWAFHQAMFLRAGQWHKLDAVLIAEELEDVGHEQYDKLESALRLVLMHLLKWDHQPDQRSRSWRTTIQNQRDQIAKLLTRNPSLKSRREEAIAIAYRAARRDAYTETGLPKATFPLECVYSWDAITSRRIALPDDAPDDE
jgi:hypothetical protein